MLEYIQANSNKKCEECICERVFEKFTNSKADLHQVKTSKMNAVYVEQKYMDTSNNQKKGLSKTFAKPKEIIRRTIWKPFAVLICRLRPVKKLLGAENASLVAVLVFMCKSC